LGVEWLSLLCAEKTLRREETRQDVIGNRGEERQRHRDSGDTEGSCAVRRDRLDRTSGCLRSVA
jgi:hypothetical protein